MRISLPDPTQFEVVFRTVTGHTIPIVGGISTDSRECRSGDLYIAICGEKVDGHDFIDNAVENGAKVILAQEHIKTDAYTVLVNNTIEAISAVASFWRNQFDIPVIAITGSNGKTTVTLLLEQILIQMHLLQELQLKQNLLLLIVLKLLLKIYYFLTVRVLLHQS